MTTQFPLDRTSDSTAHIDVNRAPVWVSDTFMRRRIDGVVGRLAVNIATLLLAFDHYLVALDDDLDALTEN